MAELSGPQAAIGQDEYDAFIMPVEQNGGKLGGVPVQVLREDSQLKPDVATQIVQKLIEKENVPIVTGITFHRDDGGATPNNRKEVFLIGSNAGPEQIAGAQCSPYQFIVSWQTGAQSEAVGKYATDKGYKRVIALAPNYQAGKDLIAGFKRYFQLPLVDEIYVPLSQMDFSAERSKLYRSRMRSMCSSPAPLVLTSFVSINTRDCSERYRYFLRQQLTEPRFPP
jgi:branched-chain amino acid transport system substrate-binding protein